MKRLLFLLLMVAPCVLDAGTVEDKDRERAKALVGQMTLQEKVMMLAGVHEFATNAIPRLGIPEVWYSDGPQGVRNVGKTNVKSTYFPCGLSVAAAWNREAARGVGKGIALDAKAHNIGGMLCPGVNIYRSPLCGRNFEYMGEDPYLASETASQYIRGMQEEGIIATIKHFAMNNSEYDRHNVSSNADERTINEIYFPVFRKAVEEAGVGAVMAGYNLINGVHCSEDPWLLKDNLRAWGFDGIVMSDWVSTYSPLGCVRSGLDLEMPMPRVFKYEYIKELVDNGMVAESEIDEKVIHILQTYSAFGFLDRDMSVSVEDAEGYDDSEPCALAYAVAKEGPVLLKNDGVLPVQPGKETRIVILGPNADFNPWGGGSGAITPRDGRAKTLYEGLASLGDGYDVTLLSPSEDGIYDMSPLKDATLVIAAMGFSAETEKEGYDRTYSLPEGQDELIKEICAHNDNVLVTVNSGGEFDVTPWIDDVEGLLLLWYAGQEAGNVFAEMVSGKISPSGRLPFTFWGSWEKNPTYNNYQLTHPMKNDRYQYIFDVYTFAEYREGIFLGYRGVEHFGIKPLFPFGYGLTYSEFEYSSPCVTSADEGGYDITFTVRNVGGHDASEVAQIYVCPLSPSIIRPEKELKGYEKVFLKKGDSRTITVHLPESSFSYYDVKTHSWVKDPGEYRILIGKSSGQEELSVKIVVPDDSLKGQLDKSRLPSPVFAANPGYVDLYWKAWRLAWDHVMYQEGLPYPEYVDEAHSQEKIWVWDSAFMVLFCKYALDVFPGLETMGNFYKTALEKDMSPLKIQHPDNPPIFAWAESECYKMTGDKEHLTELLCTDRYLQGWYDFFESMSPGQRFHYDHWHISAQRKPLGYTWNGISSGMDNTPRMRPGGGQRYRGPIDDVLWVDAISQQALSALCIFRLAKEIGNKEIEKEFSARYQRLKKLVLDHYWDEEDGCFYDIKESTLEKTKVLTPASFWPLLAEIPSKKMARRQIEYALADDKLGGFCPWVTVSRDDPDFDAVDGNYWEGGVWLPTGYMAVKALEKYGEHELASGTSEQLLEHMYRTWKEYEPHTIWECYAPNSYEPSMTSHRKRVRPDFCGWSALGPISLFIENVLGFYQMDASKGIVRWNLHQECTHGIRNLRFGDVVTDIVFDAEKGQVEVESNRPYKLFINSKAYKVKSGKTIIKL